MLYRFISFVTDERGAALAEWGLLVVLIAVVALIAVQVAGGQVSEMYADIASNLVDAGS